LTIIIRYRILIYCEHIQCFQLMLMNLPWQVETCKVICVFAINQSHLKEYTTVLFTHKALTSLACIWGVPCWNVSRSTGLSDLVWFFSVTLVGLNNSFRKDKSASSPYLFGPPYMTSLFDPRIQQACHATYVRSKLPQQNNRQIPATSWLHLCCCIHRVTKYAMGSDINNLN
jgi:hypothetical protein